MSWINTYSAMTDQRERDIARLAESNWQVRKALSGRVSRWRRLLARREQRISTATQGRSSSSDRPGVEPTDVDQFHRKFAARLPAPAQTLWTVPSRSSRPPGYTEQRIAMRGYNARWSA